MNMNRTLKAIAALMLVMVFAVGCNKPDEPNNGGMDEEVPEGAINGLFSISETQQVCFSKGNLQYIGSATIPYWRFAEQQWEYLGDNGQGSSTTNIDRDLFCWGTGDNPTSQATASLEYCEWGNNPISNGGTTGKWRTLAADEWDYIFNWRGGESGLRYAKAKLDRTNGVVLLPDGWDGSIYHLNSINLEKEPYTSNFISLNDWVNTLEPNGVVFLPAAGYRGGFVFFDVGTVGSYWSSSPCLVGAYSMSFYSRELELLDYDVDGGHGRSVRLVCTHE